MSYVGSTCNQSLILYLTFLIASDTGTIQNNSWCIIITILVPSFLLNHGCQAIPLFASMLSSRQVPKSCDVNLITNRKRVWRGGWVISCGGVAGPVTAGWMKARGDSCGHCTWLHLSSARQPRRIHSVIAICVVFFPSQYAQLWPAVALLSPGRNIPAQMYWINPSVIGPQLFFRKRALAFNLQLLSVSIFSKYISSSVASMW